MTIYCYGDSNTYGYDPCGFFGGRYSRPWPDVLATLLSTRLSDLNEDHAEEVVIINKGQNGRMIPTRLHEIQGFTADFKRYSRSLTIIMLGTNDLLNGATASEAAHRMEEFISSIQLSRTLLVSPPPFKRGAWVPDNKLINQSLKMAEEYEKLATRRGIEFADAGKWDVSLCYDGVHFTEEGHRAFARGLYCRIKNYNLENLDDRIQTHD